MTYDLAVIGGGPAGCAAAIRSARTGASVILLERGNFPRHKVCGEFVSAESLELLGELLVPEYRQLVSDSPRISRGRIFADGREVAAEINPAAASITRFEMDSALWNSCIQNGNSVDIRENCTVQTVTRAEVFTIKTTNEELQCKAVINATGRWSNLTGPATRSRLTKQRWIGVKAHFSEPDAPLSVDLYFFNGGYCGIQPIASADNGGGTRINACAMVRADVATTLAEVLRCHPALLERSRHWQPMTEPVATSPLVFHPPEPMQAGMLQVGDAATFVDPFIGDGISLALRSGSLAAECLAPFFRGECSLPQATAQYCELYDRRLARVFRNSSKLRNLLHWPKAVRKPALMFLSRSPFLARQLVRMTR